MSPRAKVVGFILGLVFMLMAIDAFCTDGHPVPPTEKVGYIEVEGVALTPEINRNGWMALPEAFEEIAKNIEAGVVHVPFLVGHDHTKVLGRVTKLEIYPTELRFTARIPKLAQNADVIALIVSGILRNVSITISEPPKVHVKNPEDWVIPVPARNIFVTDNADLTEISIITVGAFRRAMIHTVQEGNAP